VSFAPRNLPFPFEARNIYLGATQSIMPMTNLWQAPFDPLSRDRADWVTIDLDRNHFASRPSFLVSTVGNAVLQFDLDCYKRVKKPKLNIFRREELLVTVLAAAPAI
jgi:hypothetical protein